MPFDFLGGKIIIIGDHIHYIVGKNYCIKMFYPRFDRTVNSADISEHIFDSPDIGTNHSLNITVIQNLIF
jgi:hypothetical protein